MNDLLNYLWVLDSNSFLIPETIERNGVVIVPTVYFI